MPARVLRLDGIPRLGIGETPDGVDPVWKCRAVISGSEPVLYGVGGPGTEEESDELGRIVSPFTGRIRRSPCERIPKLPNKGDEDRGGGR